MPITLPNLDDRSFDDLVDEARALIPALAPEWTDHNPSDPGITLIELFAYLSEILIYRVNLVTDDNTRACLRLLNDPVTWKPSDDLAADVRHTIRNLRQPARAVTPEDFEYLARAASVDVARATCVPQRNLDPRALASDIDAPGHVSVVVLPTAGKAVTDATLAALLKTVFDYLEPRRLLTTKLHVVAPRKLKVGLRMTLWLEDDAVADEVVTRAKAAVTRFLHPLTGGGDGRGWPFGRAVFLSEIYRVLDTLPGVDFIEPTGTAEELVFNSTRRIENNPVDKKLVGVRLMPDEVVDTDIDPLVLTAAFRKRS